MTFTEEHRAHVLRQLQAHTRVSGIKRVALDEQTGTSLELLIDQGVFGSDIMSSAIYLARFLYQHPEFYTGKDVVDIGCGPGTQGIVMSKYGAKSVVFSDINLKAVANTRKNIKQQHLANAEVYESDLFAGLPKKKRMMLLCSITLSFLETQKNLREILTKMKC